MRGKRFTTKNSGEWIGSSCSGFTLIEALMVIAILSIVFSTIYNSFENFNRSCTTENVKAGIQQNARVGVEFMVHDIRQAGLDPLGKAGAGIVAVSNTSIRFTADLNFDGDVEDTMEDITYSLNGNRLQQNNLIDTVTLLDNVSNLNFTYLDEDGNATVVPAEIKAVMISLTMQRPAGADRQVARTYSTQVRCRNL